MKINTEAFLCITADEANLAIPALDLADSEAAQKLRQRLVEFVVEQGLIG